MTSAFLDRHAKVFGRSSTVVLRIAGLVAGESMGQGAHVIDTDGRAWLDFGSFGIHLLGHCHPTIVAAASTQMSRFGLSTKILANEPALRAAEKLCALTNGAHDGALFANSGSEAIEISLKICRMVTGRKRFIALEGGYHGRTEGALQLSSSYQHHAAAASTGHVSFVAPGDADALEGYLQAGTVAGVYIEPVQGEGGIRPLDAQFLRQVRALCNTHGTLMVSDEIQSGLGRSGDLVSCPDADLVVFGKTLAGGLVPISAVIFSTAKVGAHARDPITSASSYAGGALAGAVAASVLDVVRADGFLEVVNQKGALAKTSLCESLGAMPSVTSIRGRGLMIGVEFTSPSYVGETILEAAKRGLLVTFCLSAPTVLRLYPPAIATDEEICDGIARLAAAIVSASDKINEYPL